MSILGAEVIRKQVLLLWEFFFFVLKNIRFLRTSVDNVIQVGTEGTKVNLCVKVCKPKNKWVIMTCDELEHENV